MVCFGYAVQVDEKMAAIFFFNLLLNWLVEPCRVKTGTLVIQLTQIFHTSKN